MNVTGPLQVQPQAPASGFETSLRVGQRVVGDILQVSGTQAVISVDGIPVVARLASAQQGIELAGQKRAPFVVTDISGQTITLRPANAAADAALVGQVVSGRDLAARLLDQLGLPINTQTLTLIKSIISQRLMVTPELVQELQAGLDSLAGWSGAQADLAAALKAAGLPVTAESIQLAQQATQPLSGGLETLLQTLQEALNSNRVPENLKALIRENLAWLQTAMPDFNAAPEALAGQLKQMVRLLGSPVEHNLSQAAAAGENPAENGQLNLLRLQQALAQGGQTDLAETVGRFAEHLRAAQMLNVRPEPVPGSGEWTQFSFLMQNPAGAQEAANVPARLRVAHRSSGKKRGIDPAYTRLTIQVDLEPGQTMQVDLSLVGKQIQANVSAPDPVLAQNARTELPSLEQALNELGYEVRSTQVAVNHPAPEGVLMVRSGAKMNMLSVDVEI